MIDNYECCSGMVEINPAEDLHRWSVQQTITILANADYYYTKNEMDIILKRIEGKILSEEQIRAIIDQCTQEFITEAEVDAKLEDYSTKEETEAAIEEAIEHIPLDDYYTKQETNAAITAATQPLETEIANKADLSALTTHTSDSSIHVTVADKNAWNAKLDASDVEGFFGAVRYDSQTKRINFYNKTTGGTVLAYIDATDFIKDGMVSNVEIKTVSGETSLVISFNTDAGKEDIVIPISEIFDADNYYTKTEVDGALSSITSDITSVSGNVNTLSGQVQTNEATLTAHTANTTVHVTAQDKTTWNNKSDFSGDYNDLTNKPTNVSDFTNDAGYVTQTDIDESISGKADKSTVTALSAKVDTNEEVTSRALNEVNDALSGKADTSYVNDELAKKLDASAYTPTDLTNYYTKSETSGATQISTALASKADTSTTYTKTEVDNAITAATSTKQDTLVSGTNIKTINNQSILGSGNINIQGGGGSNVIELTQAQYDALTDIDPDAFYIITDADGGVSESTFTAYTAATDASKQDTLVSGTNIKTINNESLLGSGNIDIQGGSSINVVQTTGTSTTDVMSQDAVTTELDNKANKSVAVGGYQFGEDYAGVNLQFKSVSSANLGSLIYYPKINNKYILTNNAIYAQNNYNFQLVETSAITTSMSSSSTDSQVPSAKAVYDQFGGLKLVQLTQAEYDALATKDASTLYIIVN